MTGIKKRRVERLIFKFFFYSFFLSKFPDVKFRSSLRDEGRDGLLLVFMFLEMYQVFRSF